MEQNTLKHIETLINDNDVVLFMKGTAAMPTCGFSAKVVRILTELGIKFLDVDVMTSEHIRQAIKTFSNWPTIPQLYVKGEFIGGCDITKELYYSGELLELFKKNNLK